MKDRKNTWLGWFGYQRPPDFNKARWLGPLVAIVLVLFTTTLFIGIASQLFRAVFLIETVPNIRDAGLAFAAIVGFPFIVWRSVVAHRQVETARDELFNDKIKEATDNLHARAQVSRKIRGKTVNVWEDDIVRRNGAIDRLEALAVERPDMAPRVARTLCVYLREMTRLNPPTPAPREATHKDFSAWQKGLSVKRFDMEMAAQALGRLPEKTGVSPKDLEVDLSEVNLQSMRLNDLNFEYAIFNRTHLDSANLDGTKLNGARLDWVELNGASLKSTKLNRAEIKLTWLTRARLDGAELCNAQIKNSNFALANLGKAKLIGADLTASRFKGAFLAGGHLEAAKLQAANFSDVLFDGTTFNEQTDFSRIQSIAGAAFIRVDLSGVHSLEKIVSTAIGDASVVLPADIEPPAHWPSFRMGPPAFSREAERYRSNPDTYVPPQHRTD